MKLIHLLALAAWATPALATTPYQRTLPDTACNGQTACKLTFPAVAAGETLSIEHLSCSLTTTGEQGGIDSLLLTSAKAPAMIDFIPANTLLAGSNFRVVVNLPTLFTVKANDQPQISASGTSKIAGSTADGCLISGVETP